MPHLSLFHKDLWSVASTQCGQMQINETVQQQQNCCPLAFEKNMITPSNQIQQKPQNMKHMWVKQWVLQSSLQDMPKNVNSCRPLQHSSPAQTWPIGTVQFEVLQGCQSEFPKRHEFLPDVEPIIFIRKVWVYLDSLRLVSQDIGWFCKSNVDFAYNSIYIQPALCTLKQIL